MEPALTLWLAGMRISRVMIGNMHFLMHTFSTPSHRAIATLLSLNVTVELSSRKEGLSYDERIRLFFPTAAVEIYVHAMANVLHKRITSL